IEERERHQPNSFWGSFWNAVAKDNLNEAKNDMHNTAAEWAAFQASFANRKKPFEGEVNTPKPK
ncbi:MAG: hypothetical protein M3R00_06625, partial [Pseudomonadota bacterium]|nr:hypothetical protein [Pseudomonadota bacterium]